LALPAILPRLMRLNDAAMWMGLIPLAACGVVWLWRWFVPPNAVLLSLGFAVSFLADLTGKALAEQHVNSWFLSFLWPPIQLAIWWAVIAQRDRVRWAGVLGILAAGALSMIQGPLTGLELVVRGLGAIIVTILAFKTVGFERYRLAILVTGSAMLVFGIPMKVVPNTLPVWLWVWGGFQAMRLVALLLMARAILFPRTLEVIDGGGLATQARGAGRASHGSTRRAVRPPLAQA